MCAENAASKPEESPLLPQPGVVTATTGAVVAALAAGEHSMESLLNMLPEAFPWVRFLPGPDVHSFAVELVDTLRAADSIGHHASVQQMLIAWQHTAQAHSDPILLAALTKDHRTDFGPAPDPLRKR
ncbi:hypothetical protein [Streptomyces virginiae]|uniref:hypothetical protein n=1 Tax=Streptomyces virginiae TaxID=1961 RepID=UPI00224F1985|nr:hypothetical protein [Streptomyces virginiae]MCX5272030.1 hypothetical protein [Streptomyces virginiae]